jgi:hypothetical protein
MLGEQLHERGREGARRAKEWLESTTRVNVCWTNPDPIAVPKLTFAWADDTAKFSYDIGGLLLGGELDGQEFLGEVKKYANAADQGSLYDEYLAKCYRARKTTLSRCDNFFWVTWSPFRATGWQRNCSNEQIVDALIRHRGKALGIDDEAEAKAAVAADRPFIDDLATRLWLIVVCDKQIDHLILSKEHLGVIKQYETTKGA